MQDWEVDKQRIGVQRLYSSDRKIYGCYSRLVRGVSELHLMKEEAQFNQCDHSQSSCFASWFRVSTNEAVIQMKLSLTFFTH